MLPRDLEGEADWESADLTGGTDLCRRISICGDYGCLCEACSVFNESGSSSMADLLSLVIRGVEEMSRSSILEGRIRTLESTLSPNITRIGELKWPLASKTSELDVATAELKSTRRRLRFAEYADSLL